MANDPLTLLLIGRFRHLDSPRSARLDHAPRRRTPWRGMGPSQARSLNGAVAERSASVDGAKRRPLNVVVRRLSGRRLASRSNLIDVIATQPNTARNTRRCVTGMGHSLHLSRDWQDNQRGCDIRRNVEGLAQAGQMGHPCRPNSQAASPRQMATTWALDTGATSFPRSTGIPVAPKPTPNVARRRLTQRSRRTRP